jgi:diguanylate cyclase (GGDEF)-like protein
MYLDVDHFKTINDTLGHALGDEVLVEFARRLSAAVRKVDQVFRLAGDEFTIILEGVHNPAMCDILGEKIISAMREPFVLGEQLWPVTASVGIAWSDGKTAAAVSMQAAADSALYQAKSAGRNRFALAKEGQCN